MNDLYIEQEFKVLNDSLFLITRDYFQANFTLFKKEDARGVYAKRTQVFDEYKFDEKRIRVFIKNASIILTKMFIKEIRIFGQRTAWRN